MSDTVNWYKPSGNIQPFFGGHRIVPILYGFKPNTMKVLKTQNPVNHWTYRVCCHLEKVLVRVAGQRNTSQTARFMCVL